MTFTANKNIETPAHGADVNAWDVNANANFTLIDTCFSGTLLLNATGLSGAQALTQVNVQPPSIQISGAPTAAITYTVPAAIGGVWIVRNTTTGGFDVGLASLAGGGTLLVPVGTSVLMWCDGSVTGMLLGAPALNITTLTNSLSSDVPLTGGTYSDGPSVAQGTSGTWFVSGTVTVIDNGAPTSSFFAKLWDGTTVMASCALNAPTRTGAEPITLSGAITNPAGNIRISVANLTGNTSAIFWNVTGNGKDSTITAQRTG